MFILTPLLLLKQQEVDFVQILMMEGNERWSQVPFYYFILLLLFYFIIFLFSDKIVERFKKYS